MKTASWVSTGFRGRLESYEHGLRLQQNSPRCLDTALNFIFQSDNVACLRASAVDQRQRVFARDSGRSGRISLGKSRALHQPRCRNFPLRIESRVARNLESLGFGALGQVFELCLAEHGVFEERSGATAIFVSEDNQHALPPPHFPHRPPLPDTLYRTPSFSK